MFVGVTHMYRLQLDFLMYR